MQLCLKIGLVDSYHDNLSLSNGIEVAREHGEGETSDQYSRQTESGAVTTVEYGDIETSYTTKKFLFVSEVRYLKVKVRVVEGVVVQSDVVSSC